MSNTRKALRLIAIIASLIIVVAVVWGTAPTLACFFPEDGLPDRGITAYNIESGGIERCYLLYLPESYEPDRSYPVVFSLHGFSSNPHGQRVFSRWEPIADQNNFVVIYPQGTSYPQRWNADPVFRATAVDDVGFIQDLIGDLASHINIMQDQIFISGFSNGGAMTVRLACDLGDSIAAIGTVAAPVTSDLSTCNSSHTMPLIAFHGTKDPLVPYQGRTPTKWEKASLGRVHRGGITLYPAYTWVENWAAQNDCELSAPSRLDGPNYSMLHYSECGSNSEVVFYTIHGGGHSWPGGGWIPFLGSTTREINASELMWAFFADHRIPGD